MKSQLTKLRKISHTGKRMLASTIAVATLAVMLSWNTPEAYALDPFVAEIRVFAFDFAPPGWSTCEGQLILISQNEPLFSLIGTIYGGNGITTFALPDLRGRAVVGAGSGPGLSPRTLGARFDFENTTVAAANMPSHSHSATTTVSAHARAQNGAGTDNDPTGAVWAINGLEENYISAAPNVDMAANTVTASATTTVDNAGVNETETINNMQPFLTMNPCIALVGVYPSI